MTQTDDGSDDLGTMGPVLKALAHAPSGESGDGLARGELIAGKYRIERLLGRGGMGAVYLARDLRLERDVALKLGLAVSADALARAEREARALARLSHPNVVVVHEVGEHDARLFVAMEHVSGGNARTWLKAKRRSWREIVALYAAAGDGLAAAHAAGLVHRDIKPDNVLVGRDGRPRVADFGLARPDGTTATEAGGDAAAGALPDVTRTGAVLGTPAYMPPEQLAGEEVDARADQFAFCATLWEALQGVRPYSGQSAEALRSAISSGAPRRGGAAAPARGIPRHVDLALRRGLRADREDRWPSLAPLLAELRRDPGATWRRAGLATVAAGGLAAVLVVGRSSASRVDPCAGGPARIAGVWAGPRGDGGRAALTEALTDPARPWSATIATRVAGELDRWAGRWAAQYRVVCEASAAAWSPALRDRGMACLARDQAALDVTVELLTHADAETATRADDLVSALPEPAGCADPAYLSSSEPAPPSDPAAAATAATTERALARAQALLASSHLADARTTVDLAAAAADRLAYPPLAARSRMWRGRIHLELEETEAALADLREAYFACRAAGDAASATLAAAGAADALRALSRSREATDWARLADTESRQASDRGLAMVAAIALAEARAEAGDAASGRAPAEEAVALAREDDDPEALGRALIARSKIDVSAARPADGLAALDEAIALVTSRYGAEHHRLIELYGLRGFVLKKMGRYDDAITAGQTAVALAERLFGKDSLAVAGALTRLSGALMGSRRLDDALAALDRAMDISRRHGGAESNEMASDLNNRAMLLANLGRLDEAIPAWAEARRIYVARNGATHPLVGIVDGNLADALWHERRWADAKTAADRAIDALEAAGATDALAFPLTARGGSLLALGDNAGARRDLERALALRSGPDADPYLRALVQVDLAIALVNTGDREAARVMVTAAGTVARERGQAHLAEKADWVLEQLGPPTARPAAP